MDEPTGYLIGTDEAGYGPNLGPLIVSASVWQVPSRSPDFSLYPLLADAITARPNADQAPRPIAIADSKALYKPGGGLRLLEEAVITALRHLGREADCWREVWRSLTGASDASLWTASWYADYDQPLPVDAEPRRLKECGQLLANQLEQSNCELVDLRSVAVFPPEFNALVKRYGNKAEALSRVTLNLARDCIAGLPETSIALLCDKHGGRNRYSSLLQETFPDYLIEVRHESRPQSVYRWGPPCRRIEAQFRAKGEEALPAALASMTSKYLRELAMLAFNRFWQQQVPDLKPTAGYPLDARRFKSNIADAQKRLGIEDGCLWRSR